MFVDLKNVFDFTKPNRYFMWSKAHFILSQCSTSVPSETLGNHMFSGVFRGHRNETLA